VAINESRCAARHIVDDLGDVDAVVGYIQTNLAQASASNKHCE
jgi:hypothetical protein